MANVEYAYLKKTKKIEKKTARDHPTKFIQSVRADPGDESSSVIFHSKNTIYIYD